jgi:hypothetical protein
VLVLPVMTCECECGAELVMPAMTCGCECRAVQVMPLPSQEIAFGLPQCTSSLARKCSCRRELVLDPTRTDHSLTLHSFTHLDVTADCHVSQ